MKVTVLYVLNNLLMEYYLFNSLIFLFSDCRSGKQLLDIVRMDHPSLFCDIHVKEILLCLNSYT